MFDEGGRRVIRWTTVGRGRDRAVAGATWVPTLWCAYMGGRLDNLSDPLTVDGCQRHANFTCRRQTG